MYCFKFLPIGYFFFESRFYIFKGSMFYNNTKLGSFLGIGGNIFSFFSARKNKLLLGYLEDSRATWVQTGLKGNGKSGVKCCLIITAALRRQIGLFSNVDTPKHGLLDKHDLNRGACYARFTCGF